MPTYTVHTVGITDTVGTVGTTDMVGITDMVATGGASKLVPADLDKTKPPLIVYPAGFFDSDLTVMPNLPWMHKSFEKWNYPLWAGIWACRGVHADVWNFDPEGVRCDAMDGSRSGALPYPHHHRH